MAKVSIEFDTVEKSLSVSMDGKSLENVQSVQIYRSYRDRDGDEFAFEVCTAVKDEANDTVTVQRVAASEGPSKFERDVAAFFQK